MSENPQQTTEQREKENDEAVCTEFTTDHGLDETDDETYHFAFVCPSCGNKNALSGEPDDFANRPFGCMACNWVSLLDADAIQQFKVENYE